MTHREREAATVTLSFGGVEFCLAPSSCNDGNAAAETFAISKICSREVVIDLNNFVGSIRIKNQNKGQERPVPHTNSLGYPEEELVAAGPTENLAAETVAAQKKRSADVISPSTAPLEKKRRSTFDKISMGPTPPSPSTAPQQFQPHQVPQQQPMPPGDYADAPSECYAAATSVDTTETSEAAPTNNTGLWRQEEEERFLLGLRLHGWGKWKQIQAVVRTRTYSQTKAHAQKRGKANPEIHNIKCTPVPIGFEDHLNELVKFRDTHGHCNVPQANPRLGTWVKNLRATYKLHNDIKAGIMLKPNARNRTLTVDMIERLEAIGFQWTVKENAWESKFELLKEYKEENGHCHVPYNSPLGQWSSEQRKQYRKKVTKQKLTAAGTDESILAYMRHNMTDERVEKLNSIGFKWEVRVNMGEIIEGYEGILSG